MTDQPVDVLLPGERIGLDPATLSPGDRVIYLHTDRGGYGFVARVPAIVVRVRPKRVIVRVATRDGSERTIPVLALNLRAAKPDGCRRATAVSTSADDAPRRNCGGDLFLP